LNWRHCAASGRYAYPPDYNTRLEREAKMKEAEMERERKRLANPGTSGYLGMGPA
jgi:hypothetical protein